MATFDYSKIKDPFVTYWIENYKANISNGNLEGMNKKPLMYFINSRPYKDVPVVLVAAGPSLDKNIELLKNNQNNFIILCADVALFKLLENGIKPDIVASIDPSNYIGRSWQGLDTSDIILMCPTTTNPYNIKIWQGNIMLFNQIDIKGTEKGEYLKKLIQPTKNWGNLLNRYFVGATMFQIVSFFSPKKVGLVGWDFGFSGDKAYCSGFLERRIRLDNPDKDEEFITKRTEEENVWELKKDIQTLDINKKDIWTSNTLNLYKKTFLTLVESTGIPVINCTGGGILNELENMDFGEFILDNCPNKMNKIDIFSYRTKSRRHRMR